MTEFERSQSFEEHEREPVDAQIALGFVALSHEPTAFVHLLIPDTLPENTSAIGSTYLLHKFRRVTNADTLWIPHKATLVKYARTLLLPGFAEPHDEKANPNWFSKTQLGVEVGNPLAGWMLGLSERLADFNISLRRFWGAANSTGNTEIVTLFGRKIELESRAPIHRLTLIHHLVEKRQPITVHDLVRSAGFSPRTFHRAYHLDELVQMGLMAYDSKKGQDSSYILLNDKQRELLSFINDFARNIFTLDAETLTQGQSQAKTILADQNRVTSILTRSKEHSKVAGLSEIDLTINLIATLLVNNMQENTVITTSDIVALINKSGQHMDHSTALKLLKQIQAEASITGHQLVSEKLKGEHNWRLLKGA